MVKNAKDWADKQLARVRVSGDDYKKGVLNPDRPCIASAKAANAKRIANTKKALEEKRWEKAMEKVSEDDWQRKASSIGADRFIPGVEANVDKINKFITGFQPKLQTLQNSVRAMPEETDAQREARVLANLRGLKKLKGSW